jgi:DNA-binding transcriptional ArsR family regulator
MNEHVFEAARQQAEMFRLFGNANRVMILWALADQEKSVGDISDAIGSSLPNTSQHLRLLKDRGVLASRREGHTIYYHIVDPQLIAAYRILP